MKFEIPLLTANDVDLRVQQVTDKGYAILLVYKDARVDMRILDKVFGATNWKRSHKLVGENLYCTISVYDEDKKEWVDKEDVGTESNTEAEKGQASDSFKRAGFNWGIGRELYDAPFICIKLDEGEFYTNKSGRKATNAKFFVKEMTYDKDKGEYTVFNVVDSKGKQRFSLKSTEPIYVRRENNCTEVLGNNGRWYSLESMSLELLNKVVNDSRYAQCHDEARRLMMKK